MATEKEQIENRCQRYLSEEADESRISEIESLMIQTGRYNELVDRMGCDLRFGTAGLRAKVEAGYNRMNLVSVFRFAHSFGSTFQPKEPHNTQVAIGFDARTDSLVFALEVMNVLANMGTLVRIFSEAVPTPLLAYACKRMDMDAGIMITASHNPASDNGIKLYQKNGAQAHGEWLHEIEIGMSRSPLRSDFMSGINYQREPHSDQKIHRDIFSHYLEDIDETRLFDGNTKADPVPIVYTPLHGVGKKFFLKAVNGHSHRRIETVAQQDEPDGRFPTVLFPNPEEKHALDLAHGLAKHLGIKWVFANDPDADRLQVSCIDEAGDYKKLTGNQMGILLAFFSIERANHLRVDPLLATSIVSSRMLKRMCASLNAHYLDALTGFSNIVDTALKREEKDGHRLVFAYEEAIGFLVGKVVLDKDGINAGLRFLEIVDYLEGLNKTVWQFLDDLSIRFGLFVQEQWSIRFNGAKALAEMKSVMEQIRKQSLDEVVNALAVVGVKKFDLLKNQEQGPYLGLHADVVIFDSDDGTRLIARPSGTETMIKFYLELTDHATDHLMLSKKKVSLYKRILRIRENLAGLFKTRE